MGLRADGALQRGRSRGGAPSPFLSPVWAMPPSPIRATKRIVLRRSLEATGGDGKRPSRPAAFGMVHPRAAFGNPDRKHEKTAIRRGVRIPYAPLQNGFPRLISIGAGLGRGPLLRGPPLEHLDDLPAELSAAVGRVRRGFTNPSAPAGSSRGGTDGDGHPRGGRSLRQGAVTVLTADCPTPRGGRLPRPVRPPPLLEIPRPGRLPELHFGGCTGVTGQVSQPSGHSVP
jgi:hypothetical protein